MRALRCDALSRLKNAVIDIFLRKKFFLDYKLGDRLLTFVVVERRFLVFTIVLQISIMTEKLFLTVIVVSGLFIT